MLSAKRCPQFLLCQCVNSVHGNAQYIPRNMHTVFALLCFVVVIHWLIFPYPSGLLHWHCGNLTIAPVPAKQPWWIWINTSCEFIMNDCITTIKQSTTKPCAYFLGYTVPFKCMCLVMTDSSSLVGRSSFVRHVQQVLLPTVNPWEYRFIFLAKRPHRTGFNLIGWMCGIQRSVTICSLFIYAYFVTTKCEECQTRHVTSITSTKANLLCSYLLNTPICSILWEIDMLWT